MKEPQLKQLNQEHTKINQPSNQLKQIQNTPSNKQENNNKQKKYQTINHLPSWNIEPPLEIRRGN